MTMIMVMNMITTTISIAIISSAIVGIAILSSYCCAHIGRTRPYPSGPREHGHALRDYNFGNLLKSFPQSMELSPMTKDEGNSRAASMHI